MIKIGGSLTHSEKLRTCLQHIARLFANQAVVIVPGGGVFADQVRSLQQVWHFDDTTAHTMALLAMQQMALFYQSVHPEFKIISHSQDIKRQYAVQKNCSGRLIFQNLKRLSSTLLGMSLQIA